MGVRYNAEKSKVGTYYSTPIFKFRMKCHLCDNHFEIQTDPKVPQDASTSPFVLLTCVMQASNNLHSVQMRSDSSDIDYTIDYVPM